MKKTIYVILAAVMLLTAACGHPQPAAASPESTESPLPQLTADAADAEAVPEAEAQTGEEAEAVYDQQAFDAAVKAVLDEYAALDQESLESFSEEEHPELPWYTAIIANTMRNSLYYGLYDFDSNGIPELVIAAGNDDYQIPEGIYAFDGTVMHYLCKEQPLGERAMLNYADGLFAVRASGGAAQGSFALWRIAEDGFSTDLVEIMDYEYSDAETVTYTPELGNMSAEEFQTHDFMAGFDFPIEYELFAAGLN